MLEKAQGVMNTFRDTGYLLHFIQWTELIVGIALLFGFFIPLSLIILVPISINNFYQGCFEERTPYRMCYVDYFLINLIGL